MDAATLEALSTPALVLDPGSSVVAVNQRWHRAADGHHRCFPDAESGLDLPDEVAQLVRSLSAGGEEDVQCDELSCGRWWRWALRPARESDVTLLTAADVTAARRAQERATTARTLDAVGRLGGGLAHDLNNVLTGVLGYADLLELRRGREEVGAEVAGIRTSVDRARALLEQVLTFSRRRPVQPSVLDVNETLAALRPTITDVVGPAVNVDMALAADPVRVRMERVPFEHVMLNVAVHARDAMPNGGDLQITAAVRNQVAVVMLRDTGVGMDADTAARAAEPFFTTKPTLHPGLGLSVAYGIAAQHGGDLRIVSRPGVGTAVFLEIPTTDVHVVAPASVPASPTSGRTILLAEDEITIREVIASLLTDQGYRVVAAGDGAEALAMARQLGAPIDLLISDVVMPTMAGSELVQHLRRQDPSLPVVFMTGYTEHDLSEDVLGAPAPQVLHKPFGLAELLGAIKAALPEA